MNITNQILILLKWLQSDIERSLDARGSVSTAINQQELLDSLIRLMFDDKISDDESNVDILLSRLQAMYETHLFDNLKPRIIKMINRIEKNFILEKRQTILIQNINQKERIRNEQQ